MKICFSLLLMFGFVFHANAQNKTKLEQYIAQFEKMELQGIDMNNEYVYRYFFFNKNKSNLKKLANQLANENYKIVAIEKSDDIYVLNFEKSEINTVETLIKSAERFEKLAVDFKVDSFEGWELGLRRTATPILEIRKFEQSLASKTTEEIYDIGQQNFDKNNFRSQVAFEKCLEKNYKPDDCLYYIGLINNFPANESIAIQNFLKAVDLNPDNYQAATSLGKIYFEKQDFQKSIEYYEIASKVDSQNDEIFLGLAVSQYATKDYKNANINCEKSLKLEPLNAEAKRLQQLLMGKNQ